jgi:hypothetical protein
VSNIWFDILQLLPARKVKVQHFRKECIYFCNAESVLAKEFPTSKEPQ